MVIDTELQNKAINTIRFLSADGVQIANSGHPGLPMGTAAIAYTLWMRHLFHNPANPAWPNRDRFILSGGHGSMLLYSLLYLTGYGLELDELKQFRQWNSRTPGHPEAGLTPGVETTTGPLGQGLANAVGMAIATRHLASLFNRPGFKIINHLTYSLVTDGDLMEGVASEAASLAGHLQLGNLILVYDDNRISIDGSTDLAFTEDRASRFAAYGWHIRHVDDGNDVDAIDQAFLVSKRDKRPSIIVCRTHIGYGLPTKQDTAKAHGEPPGQEELDQAKQNAGWPTNPAFYVPDDVLAHFRSAEDKGRSQEEEWQDLFRRYKKEHPELAGEFERRMAGTLPDGWAKSLTVFPVDGKGMATRNASGQVLNQLADQIPELVGGSADLAPSNKSWLNNSTAFQANNPQGRNFHFGVREHGMAAIVNGMALHGGVIPYGATFLVFSDYMRGALRISALSHIHSIWIFTHDSIGVGEDGPTHQPVEHLASLRAIPNLLVLRPGDANEVLESWKLAIEQHGPTALILSRHSVPTLDRKTMNSAEGTRRGAYVLADLGNNTPEIILLASGTELSIITEAGQRLASEGISVRLVSFPSWELFSDQDQAYQDKVLPPEITARISVEAGITLGWDRWVGPKGCKIGLDRFGASAPQKVLYEKMGFTADNVVHQAKSLLNR